MIVAYLCWVVAAAVLAICVGAIAHMSCRTRHVVRCTYIVLACGSAAQIGLGLREGCVPPGLAELSFGVGVLLLLIAQHRRAWKQRNGQQGPGQDNTGGPHHA